MSCPELLREHILDLFRSLEQGFLRRLLDLLLLLLLMCVHVPRKPHSHWTCILLLIQADMTRTYGGS